MQADCEFNIRENKIADLKCQVNLEKYKEKEVYKFKTIEFQYKDSSIYLNRFNEINLVHEDKENKLNSLSLITIAAVIIIAIIIIIFIIFLIRIIFKKKYDLNSIAKKYKNRKDNTNDKDDDNYETTTNRGIKSKSSIKNKKKS